MKPRSVCLVGIMALGLLAQRQQGHGQETVPPTEKYTQAAKALETFIAAEIAAKEVPGLAIAPCRWEASRLGTGIRVRRHGEEPKDNGRDRFFPQARYPGRSPALLLMLLVRDGKVDLDAPIKKYLPGFNPRNPFKQDITLRQLLSNRSGLVREPPIGNYFDPGNASGKALVESLNDTTLTGRQGSAMTDSNAAFATAGYLLETVTKQPFEDFAVRIFGPLEMRHSSFRLTDKIKSRLAAGNGWTQYGRTFSHPTVDYAALAPAIGMFTTVQDMAKFIPALYPEKDNGLFSAEELKSAFTSVGPVVKGIPRDGLGFQLSSLGKNDRVGQGGSANGCTTELAVLPGEQLGVIVCCNKESANGLLRRIADAALSHALAVRASQPLPTLESTTPLKPGVAKTLAGRYGAGIDVVEISRSDDRAWIALPRGGIKTEVRTLGADLVGDDALAYGPKVVAQEDGLKIDREFYKRLAADTPQTIPGNWKGMIGEYGSDTEVVFVLEKDGKLHVLIEWFYLYPLKEIAPARFRIVGGRFGSYQIVEFELVRGGKADAVTVDGIKFKRRVLDGEDGSTFRIKPLRPIDEIRKDALAAKPPVEKGEFRKPDLVDLAKVEPTIKQDIRYASDNNFLSVPLYTSAKAFVQRPVAEALVRAHKKLADKGYGILVYDAYRPWYVTKMFWEATPEAQRIFVADPSKGSRHNRGCAVDITLYNLKTGKPVEMVSGYDEFSDRAYPEYPGGTSLQRYHRTLLRETMAVEGFTVYEAEWWHFDYKDWRTYPILNRRFEDLP